MYLMAAVTATTTTSNNSSNSSSKKKKKNTKHDSPACGTGHITEPQTSARGKAGLPGKSGMSAGSMSPCSASSVAGGQDYYYDLLEIDENDNSFPWGLIHHNELATMLTTGLNKTLVIDSRSFLEYNTSTIQQSVNVCCSKLVKRRLQQDKVHVLDLLNQTCNTGADASWDVVVYDQCTEDPSQLTPDNFVQVLLRKLSCTFNSVAFLKGGFLAFQASHSSLIENKTSSYRCSTLTSLSQPCMPVSNVGPTRILPFLYLGSQQDSINPEVAQVNGISYILNVSKTCPRPPHILEGHFYRIPVNDNYCEKLLPFFQEAFQFLDKVREANGCVLVHCLGGVSRSATLAIAYIMKHMKMSSDEAYRYVKDKRPTISPNFNFLGQLLEYEKIIRKEEQAEAARREAIQENNEMGYFEEKASPVMMDLHSTTSPSSPGPRTSHRSFALDFPSPLATTSYSSCPLPGPSGDDSGHRPSITSRALGLLSFESDPMAAVESSSTSRHLKLRQSTRYDASPFPRPMTEYHSQRQRAEPCPFPGPSDGLPMESSSSLHLDSVPSGQDKPSTLPFLPSPVCPITGFPSPAGVYQDSPESTCPRTGFPAPPGGFIGSSNTNTLSLHEGLGPKSMVEDSLGVEESLRDFSPSSSVASTCNQHPITSCQQAPALETSSQISPSSKSQRRQKTKHGFSLSSMFSSFRWKSRPPTLPLGSPSGLPKETMTGEATRAQLTPVSETSETSDLNVVEAESAMESMNESGTQVSHQSFQCVVESVQREIRETRSLDRDSERSLFNATISTASTQSNLLSSQISSSSCDPLPTQSRKVPSSRGLKLDPKKFTLSLSSPSAEFPVWTSASPMQQALHSPADSNKRKGGTVHGFDGPDKLAKTDRHTDRTERLVPPNTLNLSEPRPRQHLSKPTALSLSSPTAAMARLNFASPSEPPTHDWNITAAKSSQELSQGSTEMQQGSRSSCETSVRSEDKTSLSVSSNKSKVVLQCSEMEQESSSGKSLHVEQSSEMLVSRSSIQSHGSSPGDSEDWSSQSSWSEHRSMSTSSRSAISSSSSAMSASFSEASFTSSSSSLGFKAFSEFPTTSLDKLNFTPCSVRDIVQDLKNQEISLGKFSVSEDTQSSAQEETNASSSVLDSPMSISSGSSAPSLASSTLSPVETNMANLFSDPASSSISHTDRTSSSLFPYLQTDTMETGETIIGLQTVISETQPNPEQAPSQGTPVLSPLSEYALSPTSSLPQASVSPTAPSQSSSCYSQCSSMEPLSPMSLSDSSNSSPVRSPITNGISGLYSSTVSSSMSSLSSPVVSSPAYSSPSVTSPTSSCGVIASGKVVLRRNRSKRGLDRPNSIAFSSYPTCDLVSGTTGSATASSTTSSQDDASEAYRKKLRPSLTSDSHQGRGRTSWGGYSEREVYRQISAAMESAMLQTQAYAGSSQHTQQLSAARVASRKTRSMDDILDSNVDEDDFTERLSSSRRNRNPYGDHLFEQYRCGLRSGSEPYQSNSSLSSNGSHGSIHSSLEIIQVS